MDYLIPANSKKGQLIANLFRGIDLIILVIGVTISFLLLLIMDGGSIIALVFKLLPAAIAGLLVMPIAFYHNGLVFIQEMYRFYTKQSKYLWRGWCVWYVGSEETKN